MFVRSKRKEQVLDWGHMYHVFVELILFFPNKFKYVPVQTGNQDQFRPQYCNFENRIFSSNLNKKKRISFQWTWFFSFVHMIYCSIDFSQKMQANERTKFLLFVSNDKFSFFYCLLIPKVPVNLLWINKHFFSANQACWFWYNTAHNSIYNGPYKSIYFLLFWTFSYWKLWKNVKLFI